MKGNIDGCIVIIDDELGVIQRILSLFSDSLTCHIAMTGKDGLALCRELSANKVLLICGLSLPDMSGLDVCRLVKSETPHSFVMMLGSTSDQELKMSALLARADNYVSKTVSDDELELLVGNIYSTFYSANRSGFTQVNRHTVSDEIYSALETKVRSLVESYYQSSIEERSTEGCTSKYIAECLGKSHRTFQRAIKLETGYSFKQLQLIVRLEIAQGLLEEGYNVSQSADLLSFSSPAHLSRAFKDEFGITPSKYRFLV